MERRTPFEVHSRLTRINLFVSKDITSRITLGAGITYNYLTTKYISGGQPVSLMDILPLDADIEGLYHSIRPLYHLSNTYNSDRSANNKTWLGIRVSFLYRLPLWSNND